jgi:hypothetical protein
MDHHIHKVSFKLKDGTHATSALATARSVPGVNDVVTISSKLGLYMAMIDEDRANATLAALQALSIIEFAHFPAVRRLISPVVASDPPEDAPTSEDVAVLGAAAVVLGETVELAHRTTERALELLADMTSDGPTAPPRPVPHEHGED